MKAFHFSNAQIGSISSRADKSLGFRIATGEIGPEQMAQFFPLQGKNVEILIKPIDDEDGEPPVEVTSELEHKTLSQRIRGALYVWWKQQNKPGDFTQFYEAHQTKVLEHIKSKLDD